MGKAACFPHIRPSKNFPALQAADLVAFERIKALQAKRKGVPISRPAAQVFLANLVHILEGHYDVKHLEGLLASNFKGLGPAFFPSPKS
jgi:hypothetical protein